MAKRPPNKPKRTNTHNVRPLPLGGGSGTKAKKVYGGGSSGGSSSSGCGKKKSMFPVLMLQLVGLLFVVLFYALPRMGIDHLRGRACE